MREREDYYYQFGRYHLYAAERRLLRDDKPIVLTPRLFDLLLVLVKNNGRLLMKEYLIKQVWSDQIVEEHNLMVGISELRKVLENKHEGEQYIETVPRYGYRFIASVQAFGHSTYTEEDQTQELEASAAIRSIAVLKFQVLGTDLDEYLGHGMADALITRLSKIKRLMVLSPGSTIKNDRSELDPLAIGRSLGVDVVLVGQIQKASDRLRVLVRLMDTQDGRVLWAEKFDENFMNIFSVEDSISEHVARALVRDLSGGEQRLLMKRYTENPEAFQAYMKGRYYWNLRNQIGLKKGLEYFRQAIAVDPDYALAYAGLADSFAVLPFYIGVPAKEAMPKAKVAAVKAMEIDNSLAEPHASLAYVKEYYDWDWVGAEREYKQALERNPSYATAHQWYGMYLMKLGRFDEAMAELQRAKKFDPLSHIINADLGLPFYFTEQYEQAIQQYRRTLEVDPNFIWARYFLGWAYEKTGEFSKAIAEFQRARQLNDTPEVLCMIARVHALSGNKDEVLKVLSRLTKVSGKRYISPYYIALIYAGLKEADQTFIWLARARDDRNEWLVWLKVDPRFDSIRSHPKFSDLIQQLGFGGTAAGQPKKVASIAVLPFVNASGNSNLEHLSSGVTERVINSMSRSTKIRVMANSIVSRYKGLNIDPIEAGRELGVHTVLVGRVFQLNDSLIVGAELIDLADGAQIWGEQYHRKLGNLITDPEEIAREISTELRLKLSDNDGS